MNYYYEPVNLEQWNLFEKVKSVGHIEYFLATKEMKKGDYLLLNVGQQDKSTETGVYAIAEIIMEPSILEGFVGDYCNGKLAVKSKIIRMENSKPIIDKENSKKIFTQFRTVHKVHQDKKALIEELIQVSEDELKIAELVKEDNLILEVGVLNNEFSTIKETVNYCFDANIDFDMRKGHYPLKKGVWEYYIAWFPKFVHKEDQNPPEENNMMDAKWYNFLSEDGRKITEYNKGLPANKDDMEKDFYRIVFGKYLRENLLNKYKCKCMLCGLGYKELLIASHIKAWSISSNEERLDVNNGLLLCSLHDSLFDKHLISFDEEGGVIISNKLDAKNRALCNISEKVCIILSPEMEKYMKFHRDVFIEKDIIL